MNPSNLSNPSNPIKSPPASGKSRALMFIALDKLHNKGLRQAPHFKAFTLIEEAGHWVQFERADAFDEALLAVLNARP